MIQQLFIQNLVLIEKATIDFGPNLNILTGETGAGKSAVLSAIRLILGERADVQLVGSRSDIAVVEAEIALKNTQVHIRREIHKSGKSRCFVEDELVTLGELKGLFQDCIELTDQGSAFKFSDPEELRKLLDLFAGIELVPLTDAYLACEQKKSQLQELMALQENLRLEEEKFREQLTFLEKIDWQSGEEEELELSHTELIRAQKSAEKVSEILAFLSEGSIASTLKRFAHQLESLQLSEISVALHSAYANLEEAGSLLDSHVAGLDYSVERLERVEERMSEIESVKRRMAKTHPEAATMMESLRTRLGRLDKLEEEMEETKASLDLLEGHLKTLEKELTQKRTKAAEQLTNVLLAEVRELNLPDAQLSIQIHPKKSSPNGTDDIRWLFTANKGQPLLPLGQIASGGELSRLLLALKLSLKEKKCLIFDEIDSNVGGQTATRIGAKLQELGNACQVICVTHFVQVAKCAMHHFLVSKQTEGHSAMTCLQRLSEAGKIAEYARMTGGIL